MSGPWQTFQPVQPFNGQLDPQSPTFGASAMANDEEGKAEARESIARFNEKSPSTRVTPVHLMRSVKARRQRIAQAHQGVYLPRKRQGAMEEGRFAVAD